MWILDDAQRFENRRENLQLRGYGFVDVPLDQDCILNHKEICGIEKREREIYRHHRIKENLSLSPNQRNVRNLSPIPNHRRRRRASEGRLEVLTLDEQTSLIFPLLSN